jgi:3-hydroxyisobutyrate dehydrogenase-like beta-hydroxyacid dehydrogenase
LLEREKKMTGAPQIGWVGLGRMGSRMAPNLVKGGFTVSGFDLDRNLTAAAAAHGVAEAATLSSLVARSDAIVSMIPNDDAFLDVARSVRDNAKPSACLIDMSTISPAASGQGAAILDAGGISYLRAPVSGSTALAEAGTLSILVSGPEPAFQAWRALIAMLGKKISYLGPGEEARIMKLVVNTIVAVINTSLGEALNLGRRSGLDWNAMIDVIGESAVASPYIASKIDKLKQRDWSPAATVEVIAKDVDLALDLARLNGSFTPMTALARQVLTAVEGRGQGKLDLSCVATFFD